MVICSHVFGFSVVLNSLGLMFRSFAPCAAGGCACSSGDGGYEGTLGRNAAVMSKVEGREAKAEDPAPAFDPRPSTLDPRLNRDLLVLRVIESVDRGEVRPRPSENRRNGSAPYRMELA